MQRVSPSTTGIIQPIPIAMDEGVSCSADQEKRSCCEPEQGTLYGCGDDSLTAQDRRELIVLFSATKARFSHLSLSDRLTPSLMSCGLVCGITPMSIRERLGAEIPDFAFSLPGGGYVAQHNTGCEYWSGRQE